MATTEVIAGSPPRFTEQAPHVPNMMVQTEEFYHSHEYYQGIDRLGRTFAKIDGKTELSCVFARVATDAIHSVLREFIREPVIQSTRKLFKTTTECSPDDLGLFIERELFLAKDAKRLVRVTDKPTNVLARIPLQVAQNLAQQVPLIRVLAPIERDLCKRMLAVFYYSFRPELQLLKVLHNKTAIEPIAEDEKMLPILYENILSKTKTSMINHLISEVFRRMVVVDGRFADQPGVSKILLAEGGVDWTHFFRDPNETAVEPVQQKVALSEEELLESLLRAAKSGKIRIHTQEELEQAKQAAKEEFRQAMHEFYQGMAAGVSDLRAYLENK